MPTSLELAGTGTEQIDLGGKTVLPGLIDSHVHAPSASMYEFEQPVPDMESVEDVLAYIRTRASQTKPGQWIALSQVFITRLREQRYPTRLELDQAAPRHPVVFRTGPDASLNSAALRDQRHRRDVSRARWRAVPRRARRARASRPASCATARRYHPFAVHRAGADHGRSPRAPAAAARRLQLGRHHQHRRRQRRSSPESSCIARCSRSSELTCRTFLAYGVDAQAPLDHVEAAIREAAAHPLHKHDDMLWLRGIKAFLDGGMLTGSAYMRQPWGVSKIYAIDDPTYRGVLFIEPEKLYRIAKLALENELQFTAHSQGDAAVQTLLDAYERINREASRCATGGPASPTPTS